MKIHLLQKIHHNHDPKGIFATGMVHNMGGLITALCDFRDWPPFPNNCTMDIAKVTCKVCLNKLTRLADLKPDTPTEIIIDKLTEMNKIESITQVQHL